MALDYELQSRKLLILFTSVRDMDNSRIVVIGAVKAHDYDSYKLGYEPIKYGRIR